MGYKKDIEAAKTMGYKKDREAAYPTAQDQLDQIFKDLKNGPLKDGEWYRTIAKIKADYEKPHVSEKE